MRKFILCLVSLLIMGSSFAITEDRKAELQQEGQQLLQAKQVRIQELQQINDRLKEISGIFKEEAREQAAEEKPKGE